MHGSGPGGPTTPGPGDDLEPPGSLRPTPYHLSDPTPASGSGAPPQLYGMALQAPARAWSATPSGATALDPQPVLAGPRTNVPDAVQIEITSRPDEPGQGVGYRTTVLRTAVTTLNLADRQVQRWTRRIQQQPQTSRPTVERLGKTIEDLQDIDWWLRLLPAPDSTEDADAVKAAVQKLIVGIKQTQVAADTAETVNAFNQVRAAIRALRREIGRHDPRHITDERAHQFDLTAKDVYWQVTAAGAAIMTSTTVDSGRYSTHLILGGLAGSLAAAVVGVLRGRITVSPQDRLKQTCELLRDRLQLLADTLRQCSQGPSSAEDQWASAEGIALDARYLNAYTRWLTADDTRPGYIEFREFNDTANNLLNHVREAIDKRDRRRVSALAKQVLELVQRLDNIRYYYDPPDRRR